MGESILRDRKILFESGPSSDGPDYRKGNGLIFPYRNVDNEWQHKRNWGRWREPREEFSFLFNSATDLGIGLTGDKVCGLAKQYFFLLSGALSTALENPVA
jgi:hypothetical protein